MSGFAGLSSAELGLVALGPSVLGLTLLELAGKSWTGHVWDRECTNLFS